MFPGTQKLRWCIFHRHVCLLELPTHFVSNLPPVGFPIIIPTDVISDVALACPGT